MNGGWVEEEELEQNFMEEERVDVEVVVVVEVKGSQEVSYDGERHDQMVRKS